MLATAFFVALLRSLRHSKEVVPRTDVRSDEIGAKQLAQGHSDKSHDAIAAGKFTDDRDVMTDYYQRLLDAVACLPEWPRAKFDVA
jgi:hypothetical protein